MAGEWAIVAAAGVGVAGAGIPALVSLRQAKIQADARTKAERAAAQAALLGRIAQDAAQYQHTMVSAESLTASLYELSVTGTTAEIRRVAVDWLDDLRGNSSQHTERGIHHLRRLSETVE